MYTVRNTVKTFSLLLVLAGMLLLVGAFLGGLPGVLVALVFAGVMNIAAYWYSDKVALAMHRAHKVSVEDEPVLHEIVASLATRSGMPKPAVYVVESESANAFATGRSPKRATVAATRGIMRILDRDELEAVMGHELSHVGNRDTLIMTMVAVIAGAISLIAIMARWSLFFGGGRRGNAGAFGMIGILVVAIVMPLTAMIVRFAISRTREFQADAYGARLSGKPEALASALEKLQLSARQKPLKVPEATAHLFIVNPLSSGNMSRLFSTHPPTEERTRRLRAMRGLGGSPFA